MNQISSIRTFTTIGSTNDYAAEWAAQGAPHLSLVIADEQTAGRGRGDRRWFTPPGAALAFSLILKPHTAQTITRYAGLGALAVCHSLQDLGLPARIKWPNDVLINRRKTCGILAEASWLGDHIQSIILGIGVNVTPQSVPPPDWPGHHEHPFPPTCVQTELGRPLDRHDLLQTILNHLCAWLPRLEHPDFLRAWEENLALRGEWVHIYAGDASPLKAQIINLNPDGSLNVRLPSGRIQRLHDGEIHLRPVDSSTK